MDLLYSVLECRMEAFSNIGVMEALPFTLANAAATIREGRDDLVVQGYFDSFYIDCKACTTALHNVGLQMSRYMIPKLFLIWILRIMSLYFHN